MRKNDFGGFSNARVRALQVRLHFLNTLYNSIVLTAKSFTDLSRMVHSVEFFFGKLAPPTHTLKNATFKVRNVTLRRLAVTSLKKLALIRDHESKSSFQKCL